MPKKVEIVITNPKAMFNVGHISGTADNFTSINAHVTGAGAGSDISLNDGVLFKNIGANAVKVAFSGATHGANTGFKLAENEQLFVESNSLSNVLVRNFTSGQGITFTAYANWGDVWQKIQTLN